MKSVQLECLKSALRDVENAQHQLEKLIKISSNPDELYDFKWLREGHAFWVEEIRSVLIKFEDE